MQLIASTAKDYAGFLAGIDTNQADQTDTYLIDVAVGGAGSENVIIPNLSLKSAGAAGLSPEPNTGPFYIAVPAGTRIAARLQAVENERC